MWKKALVAALLALVVGFVYHTDPTVPERLLEVLSHSLATLQEAPSVEETIAVAWETLITAPGQQWSRVAVGCVCWTGNIVPLIPNCQITRCFWGH